MLFIVVGRDINSWYARYSSCIWSTMVANKSQHVKLKKTTIQRVIINMENSSLRHDILLIIITKYWNCCCILPSSPQFQSYHHHNADAISIFPSPPNPLPSPSPASKPPPYLYSLADSSATNEDAVTTAATMFHQRQRSGHQRPATSSGTE